MFPDSSKKNSTNKCLTNIKYICNFALKIISCLIQFSYLLHILFGQLGHSMFFAFGHILSVFIKFISHIISMGSKKKMYGITTRWIITMMKYFYSRWNIPINKFPCYSMSIFRCIVKIKLAVSLWKTSRLPFPAIIQSFDVNLFPKTFFIWSNFFSHIISLIGAAPGKTDFLLQSSVPGGDINKNIRFAKLCSEFIIPHLGWSSC